MVFISTILAMLLFATMGLSMVSVVSTGTAGSVEDMTATQAFHVAEGGMQYVLQNQFMGDSNFSNNVSPTGAPFGGTPVALNPGQFWVQYSNQTTSSVDVTVTSRVGNAVRVVRQTVSQGTGGIDYAAMANGNININSASGDIFGGIAFRGNANIDDDVEVHGGTVDDPTLSVPTMSLPTYQAMCTTTHTGNLTISSSMAGNLCVTGNVTINAGVTYTGLLYSSGNVNISGNNVVINGTVVAAGNLNGNNSAGLRFNANAGMPAVVSNGNVNLNQTDALQVTGLVWSGGNAIFNNADDMVLRGSIVSRGNFLMNSTSNLSLTYDASLIAGLQGLSGSQGASLNLSGWKAN